jgi:hypothetical protein
MIGLIGHLNAILNQSLFINENGFYYGYMVAGLCVWIDLSPTLS